LADLGARAVGDGVLELLANRIGGALRHAVREQVQDLVDRVLDMERAFLAPRQWLPGRRRTETTRGTSGRRFRRPGRSRRQFLPTRPAASRGQRCRRRVPSPLSEAPRVPLASAGATGSDTETDSLMNAGEQSSSEHPSACRWRNSTHVRPTTLDGARYVARNGPTTPLSSVGTIHAV